MKRIEMGAVFFAVGVFFTQAFSLEVTLIRDDSPFKSTLESRLLRPNAEGLLWTSGFEEGCFQFVIGGRPADTNGPLWAQAQFQDPGYSVMFTESLVRSGNKSLRLEWRKSGVTDNNTSKKAMVHWGKAESPQAERWYGFSMYFPATEFPVEPYNIVIFQVKGTPDFHLGEPYRKPPLAFRIERGVLTCIYSYDFVELSPKNDNNDLNRKVVPICVQEDLWDRWTDFVVHAKFSLEEKGIVEVWKNGEKVVDLHNINLGYNDVVGVFPSFGIYSYNGMDRRVGFLDEVRIGDENSTYESVAHGKLDGTQIPMCVAVE
jgi:hypothetical protein